MPDLKPRRVLVTGANGYIGNAVAKAFVRAGWITYGLVRKESEIFSLSSEEIIPLLGSPADTAFLKSLGEKGVVFDVLVSTTESMLDYIPHYKDIISHFRTIAATSNAADIRPLVLFTSGYYAVKTFDNDGLFDSILLRPTNVYGLRSSYYGHFFKLASEAKSKGVLEFKENPQTILHALHVDDCGEAYVRLADFPDRDLVKQQCYNISSHRYETLEKIGEALVREYEIPGGLKFLPADYGVDEGPNVNPARMLTGFSQWTGSEKLRRHVGWKDRRIIFSEALHQYRMAYEVASKEGYAPWDFKSKT